MTPTCTCVYKIKLKPVSLSCCSLPLLSICCVLSVTPIHAICSSIFGSTQGSIVCPCVSALQSSTVTRRPASYSDSAAHLWCSTCIAGLFVILCAVSNLVLHLGWRNDEWIIVLFGVSFFPNCTFSFICLCFQSLKRWLSKLYCSVHSQGAVPQLVVEFSIYQTRQKTLKIYLSVLWPVC